MRRGQFLQPLQCLDPALRLACLGCLGLEAADEAFHVRTLRLLFLVGLLLLRQTLGAGAFERRVAAAIEGQLALLQMDDVVDHRVEKVAVVGDQQQRAGIALEPVLEPEDRIQVEVVGRLVQQQEVRRTHQRLRQIQTHAPATGKATDRQRHLFVGKAQPGEQLARPCIGAVTVGIVQLAVQARQGVAVMSLLGSSQVVLNTTQLDVAVEHVIHRQAVEGIDLLAHVRDAPIRRQLAVATIGHQLATQQGEECGFAGTVGTDQAGLLAGMQGQLGAFQQTLRATL